MKSTKRTFRRALSLVLAVIMLLGMVPAMNISAAEVQIEAVSNTTDAGFEYEISDGEVTIIGYIGSDTELTIPSEIEGYPVTNIGDRAFEGCYYLKNIEIPQSVKNIGSYAFMFCYSIVEITIPEGVVSIGEGAFADCILLSNITLPTSLTRIAVGTFSCCRSLEYFVIPEGVKSIDSYAFYGCESLESVVFSKSVANISSDAFTFCSSLVEIEVDSNNVVFDSRDNCNAVIETATNTLILGCVNTNIPESVICIGAYAFSQRTTLVDIIIPKSVNSIGKHAFSDCYSLENVYISDIAAWCNIDFNDFNSNPLYYADNLYLNNEFVKDVIIPEGVTKIPDYAFSCVSLENVTIPESVESIGDGAFEDCSLLKKIIIPSRVKSIGENAFDGCISLSGIKVDVNNTSYDSRNNCNALIETASNTLIQGCNNSVIPDGITSINDFAFYECDFIESVVIPEGVKTIGARAFSGCDALSSITIPSSVTDIGFSAFDETAYYNNPSNWKDEVLYIDSALIDANYALSGEYNVNEETTVIADSAFSECYSLEKITIPTGVNHIGASTFSSCNSLKSVIISNGVTDIGAFAFYCCGSLESVSIPKSVTYVSDAAFYQCGSLTDVYYGGTKENWNQLSIEANNSDLTSAIVHFNLDDQEPTESSAAETDPTEAPTQTPTEVPSEVPTTIPATSVPETEITFPEDYISDEKTNVAVGGNTDKEVELKVSEVTSDKEIEDIDLILIGEKVNKVFDITLQKDGVEVQPDGKVWVRIPAENPLSKVYRMETDGTLTDMNAVYVDGYLVFTTEHFSLYVVAEPAEETDDPTPPAEDEPEVKYLIGDANGDGKINVKDATQIQKAVAGLVTLDEVGNLAADSDQNEKVNVKDATAIQKFVAGIPVDAPIGEERTK